MDNKYLKPNAIAEPLINQWYAWSYLISPATAARYIAKSHIKILESFIESPQAHQTALKNPAMLGGPFINYSINYVEKIQALLEKTKTKQANLLTLSAAIEDLENLLQQATGYSLEPLYQQIPEPLKGYVELVYDANNHASIRYIERLLYQNPAYQTAQQTVALSLINEDSRSFVLSTPRLTDEHSLHLNFPFKHPIWDDLFRMRNHPDSYNKIKEALGIKSSDETLFSSLFTQEPPRQSNNYTGDSVKIRYFGHACVLFETKNITILCDPLVSYQHQNGIERYTYTDLPEIIDYVLITHNHQDHVMFETLLQLRHKIRQIIVPKGNKGVLIDPSLKLILEQIGFTNVKEIDELETIEFSDGCIVGLPVFGEHGDLNIATKIAYWLNLKGKKILCAADSNNIEPALYKHLYKILGNLDILFIGMECDGAPYTWAYGALLTQSIPRKMSQTRRLDGSNAEKAINLVNQFQPQQVYVYAMGQEPWLTYITSIKYTEDSHPIIESDKLVQFCRDNGIASDRLFGCREFILEENAKPCTSNHHHKASIDQLLEELSQKDIKVWIEEDLNTTEPKLKCNAPKGVLTPRLQAQIKERKTEIVEFLRNRDRPKVDLAAEAVLDPTIQPSTTTSSVDFNRVLLTGATGFLGAFLLFELLQNQAKIYCLVRAESFEAAQHRIKECLQSYLLWQESFSSQIIPIVGDLTQPLLGLSPTQFQTLADEIATIYHNGAWVHHTLPYSMLKATNVLGTQEVLKLACSSKAKPVHFISSISVFSPNSTEETIYESNQLDIKSAPVGGYAQTKWVAEKLVSIARDRGLSVSIYRLGAVAGHSKTGVFNRDDFLYKLIQGCIQIGSAPISDMMLNIIPIDYTSQAIIHLSKQSPNVYHLVHPQPVSIDLLFDQLHTMGYDIKRLPYKQWREQLLKIAATDQQHPLYAIASLFPAEKQSPSTNINFNCHNTRTELAKTSINCPPIDSTLLNNYITHLMQNNLLDVPKQLI
ncbi:thioester reductase domain protein (plasmid) [Gloeocapsa sp. PCC 7428]|uniref:thioester reductase domain-containing protein n=1 Tax=Gloeocapsa sp. PCC 7428 TaxID=1173026 RepID=UPI0002A5D3BC|nr:thioester reductase domain-containing protein [Gloeocapsa sp. PCC 7428]AFZ33308.1 thioester reductase domain protein [Gloeocapsa sp. PCC 7428]